MRLTVDLIQPVIDALTAEFKRPGQDRYALQAALRERNSWRRLLRQARKAEAQPSGITDTNPHSDKFFLGE